MERVQDVMKVKNFILQLFATIVTDFFVFLVFSWLLFQIHWGLFLLFLFYFFLSLGLGFLLYRGKKKRKKKTLSKSDFVQSLLVETFQNVDTVKGLHLEYEFLEQLKREYQSYLVRGYLLEKSWFMKI